MIVTAANDSMCVDVPGLGRTELVRGALIMKSPVADPASATVTVYRRSKEVTLLDSSDTLSGGDIVPGFELPVSRVF